MLPFQGRLHLVLGCITGVANLSLVIVCETVVWLHELIAQGPLGQFSIAVKDATVS